MARICVITAGHLATCPRMTKAADALMAAGHEVRVVSTCHTPWAVRADEEMRATRAWRWRSVDYRFDAARVLYMRSGLRGRFARAAARKLGATRVPFAAAVNAYARVHPELVNAALEEPADLYYGGTTGALAATAEASERAGVPYGLDLEDFHGEEQEGPDGPLMNQLGARILARVLPDAAFLTTSSAANATEYGRRYGVDVVTINNTFPLPRQQPSLDARPDGSPLKTYWFSQTIGPGRGLEGFVRGAGGADVPIELHLRGRSDAGYVEELTGFARSIAPRLSIFIHDPASPDSMVRLCEQHHIGLAVEEGHMLSHELSLSNKALTYILAGLAVVLTDTRGQQELATELNEGALTYREGDHRTLSDGLRRWYQEPARLLAARQAAWAAAVKRWHWEHPSQRGALVAAVARGLS
jgi:hypothetical protein